MFWKKAREKYKNLKEEDSDISKYLKIMDKLQEEGYAGLAGRMLDLGHKFISRHMADGRVLEIGFGKGRQASFLKKDPDKYYPIDINKKYINEKIWNKFKNALIADARDLPFSDDVFDNVVSIYSLEHIEGIHKVVVEIKRVLKPNGAFLVALPCEDGLAWNIGRELTTRRFFMGKYKINYDKLTAFEHVHNLKYLKKVLEENFKKGKEFFLPFFIRSINVNLIYCGIFINNK